MWAFENRVMAKAGINKNEIEENGDPIFYMDDELYRKNNMRR
jgi:hypothetical protein